MSLSYFLLLKCHLSFDGIRVFVVYKEHAMIDVINRMFISLI